MENKLMPLQQANVLIQAGKTLMIAGDEKLLLQLSKGNWIGGTIPYFMDDKGGCVDFQQVFVTDFTEIITNFSIKAYHSQQLPNMLSDRYKNGFSYVLLPAFSDVHSAYALEVRYLDQLFDVPTMGWVTGVHLDVIETQKPKVINGQTKEVFENEAVVLHCQLQEHKFAEIEIVNIYEQSQEAQFVFPEDNFTCSDCLINGEIGNLADYLTENKIDLSLPLVANHGGALINADIKKVDMQTRSVSFFAPILSTQEYRIAKPIIDRYAAFLEAMPQENSKVICSCNCLSSYHQLGLNGKTTKGVNSPFTFGEIAYILVNQTMVLLSVKDK